MSETNYGAEVVCPYCGLMKIESFSEEKRRFITVCDIGLNPCGRDYAVYIASCFYHDTNEMRYIVQCAAIEKTPDNWVVNGKLKIALDLSSQNYG